MGTGAAFNSWETVRYELLQSRICDLGLSPRSPRLAPFLRQLAHDLDAKGLRFRPSSYLTDSWGCPDRVPVIGIPFYLADDRLARIEEEQTGEVESPQSTLMLLRHEAAHAYNYAFRLWEDPEWSETFGSFHEPYRDVFQPNPRSRSYVQHITAHQYGPTYAQKHPDEDFAETFAVVLTPRSGWRRRYARWPVYRKLTYVERLIREIGARSPQVKGGDLLRPVEELTMTVAEHYGERAERFRAAAQGYVDDRLREAFGPLKGEGIPLGPVIRRHRQRLADAMARWSGLRAEDATAILSKLEERAEALGLELPTRRREAALMDLASLATAVALDYAYTGQLLA
jgi:hypothetical protein